MDIHSFRDDDSEYQDYMDMTGCIPSTRASSSTLMDSLEEQVTPGSSISPSKEAIR